MKRLTLQQLLELHVLVIGQSGGGEGIRDLGRLEAALATQNQAVFDEELYSTIQEKAAALIHGVIVDHVFVDGNKRTAMLAGLTLLKINGIQFLFDQGEIEDFAVQIAIGHLDVMTIAAWLKAHSS